MQQHIPLWASGAAFSASHKVINVRKVGMHLNWRCTKSLGDIIWRWYRNLMVLLTIVERIDRSNSPIESDSIRNGAGDTSSARVMVGSYRFAYLEFWRTSLLERRNLCEILCRNEGISKYGLIKFIESWFSYVTFANTTNCWRWFPLCATSDKRCEKGSHQKIINSCFTLQRYIVMGSVIAFSRNQHCPTKRTI